MDKSEKIGKSFILISASAAINMVIGFLTTPIITRLVDPDKYGQFSIFTLYTSLSVMVLCLGLDQSLIRYFYEKEEKRYKNSLLCKCIVLPTLLSIVFGVITLILISQKIIVFEFNLFSSVILVVNIVIHLLYRFFSLLVRLNHNNKLYAKLQIIHKISYVGLVIIFLKLSNADSFHILAIATFFSALICLSISFYSQRREYVIYNFTLSGEPSYKILLKYGYPYIFSMGITSLFQGIDKMSLNVYCTYADVGIYSSAMTLIHIFAIIQTTFNTVWAPVSIEHYTKQPDDKDYYKRAFNIISFAMFAMGISMILVKDVFALILGSKYREAAYIMPYLIFSPVMYTISETTVGGINYLKKSKYHVLIASVACIINLSGNTILVPLIGGKGAAISTGFSYIVFFLMRTIIAEKFYKVGFGIKKVMIITVLTSMYALYNTFVRFNFIAIAGALICYIVLFILYKEEANWLLKYGKNNLCKMIKP